MPSDYRILFHVTPESNLANIRINGLDPKYSTGVFKRSWLVQKKKLEWAIIHTSARHDLPTDKLYIFIFDAHRDTVTRFATPNVYYSTHILMPEDHFPAIQYEIEANYNMIISTAVNRDGLFGLTGWEG